MAVRFLPPPEENDGPPGGTDRADLAEVIELRSRLRGPEWSDADETSRSDERLGAPGGGSPHRAAQRSAEAGHDAGLPKGSGGGNVVRVGFGADARAWGGKSAEAECAGAADTALTGWSDERASASEATVGSQEQSEPRHARPRERSTRTHASSSQQARSRAFSDAGAADGDAVDEGPTRSAHEDGVRLLARKAKSSGELREELLAIGHAVSDVEEVVAEFEANCYLDDDGLARALTEKLRDTKRASRAQIRRKLRDRRLPDAAIELAIGELDSDEEYALLREAAQDRARRLADLDRQTAERRLLGFLSRRGWSGEPAMRAVREALDGVSSGRARGATSGVRFQ